MRWINVKSSNVKSIAWEKNSLFVKFKSSPETMYKYSPVSVEGFGKILTTESIGSLLNKEIIKNPNINTEKLTIEN